MKKLSFFHTPFVYFSLSLCNYRLLNCGARRADLRPYFNRLSDDFP